MCWRKRCTASLFDVTGNSPFPRCTKPEAPIPASCIFRACMPRHGVVFRSGLLYKNKIIRRERRFPYLLCEQVCRAYTPHLDGERVTVYPGILAYNPWRRITCVAYKTSCLKQSGLQGDSMPIYEYRCTKCGAGFEDIVGVNDPSPECPECNSPKTEKLMSRACVRSSGGYDGGDGGASSGGSGCAGCSGGNCASCG